MTTILDQLNEKRKEKQELETANIAILEETSENPDAAEWKLSEWQSWLEDNGFSPKLIHSALQQAYSASGHQAEFEAIQTDLLKQDANDITLTEAIEISQKHNHDFTHALISELHQSATNNHQLLSVAGGTSSNQHLQTSNSSKNNSTSKEKPGGGIQGIAGLAATAGLGYYLFSRGKKSGLREAAEKNSAKIENNASDNIDRTIKEEAGISEKAIGEQVDQAKSEARAAEQNVAEKADTEAKESLQETKKINYTIQNDEDDLDDF